LFSINENQLGGFLTSIGCDVKHINIHRLDGRSRGFAHVEFFDRKSLEIAVNQNGTTFEGRYLKVDVSQGRKSKSLYNDDRGENNPRDRQRDRRDQTGYGNKFQNRENNNGGYHPAERDQRRASNYGGRGGSGGRNVDGNSAEIPPEGIPSPAPVPTVRPKLELKARTLPIEAVGKPAQTATSIFGEGKPRDEAAYEVIWPHLL